MRVSKTVLLALKGLDGEGKTRLAAEMGITEDTFRRWIRTNDEKLTLASVLIVLSKELGLNNDQLLEEKTEVKV